MKAPCPRSTARKPGLRLRVNDFSAAVKFLREAALITDEREGKLIALAKSAGPDEVVRCLVGHSISVYEITSHEPTLEDFYLSLMKAGKS